MTVCVKKDSFLIVALLSVAVVSTASAPQPSRDEEVPPRIARLEQWLSAIALHQPGALDDSVRLVRSWNQQELQLVWVDMLTIVSLIRQPDVSLFYVSEPTPRDPSTRQISPVATNRSRQVLYTGGELRRLRAIVTRVSADGTPGPENDMLKRGAMLHADVEMLAGRSEAAASTSRPGPAGATLFMDDGQQLGLTNTVSHWNMGRRLLESVRPLNSRDSIKTRPDPAADETVRRWYVAGCAYMLRTQFIELEQFSRALRLFPNDPDVLFFVASVHENLAGVRTQSVMRSMKGPRDINFDVQEEGAELRLAEQLYKRTLERKPTLIEARIRLGRVLGLRGRHEEAIELLRQGRTAAEPLLQFYAHLFLAGEFEALGNGAEARQAYERAAELAPTAQSPLLGLSRLADQTGDRTAAREFIRRLLDLPDLDRDRADPWWVYEVVQARAVDGLLHDLRQRIAALPR
jgi:tetratricopeptide (TPR) repeat protein